MLTFVLLFSELVSIVSVFGLSIVTLLVESGTTSFALLVEIVSSCPESFALQVQSSDEIVIFS